MNWLSTAKLGSSRVQVAEDGAKDSDDDSDDQEPELEVICSGKVKSGKYGFVVRYVYGLVFSRVQQEVLWKK